MEYFDSHYDAIIIGIGAMGSATLYKLASRGYDICGIEQFNIAHNKGSSHGETRLIRKAYFEHPDYVSLLHKAYEEWEKLDEQSNQSLFTKNGMLLAGTHDSSLIQGLAACYSEHDLPHEVMDVTEAQQRWPQIKLPDNVEVYYDPIAGYLRVEECVHQFCRLATENGADLFTNEKVTDWSSNNGTFRITTDKRTLFTERLIITCGAWSKAFLNNINLKLGVLRKVLFWYDTDDLKPFQPVSFPSFLIESDGNGFYGFPAINDAGVKVGEHYQKQLVSHPDNLDRKIHKKEVKPFSNFVEQTFPLLNTYPSKGEVCMYTMTKDEHFIIDRHPDYKNVVIGAGFSGHGFKFAPVIANILTDLVIDGTTTYPIELFQLSRFTQ